MRELTFAERPYDYFLKDEIVVVRAGGAEDADGSGGAHACGAETLHRQG